MLARTFAAQTFSLRFTARKRLVSDIVRRREKPLAERTAEGREPREAGRSEAGVRSSPKRSFEFEFAAAKNLLANEYFPYRIRSYS